MVKEGKRVRGGLEQNMNSHSYASALAGGNLCLSNTNILGYSALSHRALDCMVALLNADVTPCVPSCGSISASGDLIPLSYLAEMIVGSDEVDAELPDGRITSSKEALEWVGLTPVALHAKEGLALVNGTAACASLACSVLFDSIGLCHLAQVLTTMCVEALNGTEESFAPFISEIRPHPGQIEASSNIAFLLKGTQLSSTSISTKTATETLQKDHYALRSCLNGLDQPYDRIATRCALHHNGLVLILRQCVISQRLSRLN